METAKIKKFIPEGSQYGDFKVLGPEGKDESTGATLWKCECTHCHKERKLMYFQVMRLEGRHCLCYYRGGRNKVEEVDMDKIFTSISAIIEKAPTVGIDVVTFLDGLVSKMDTAANPDESEALRHEIGRLTTELSRRDAMIMQLVDGIKDLQSMVNSYKGMAVMDKIKNMPKLFSHLEGHVTALDYCIKIVSA